MCGIIGAISAETDIIPGLLQGLKRVEYRGYDSAGIATLVGGQITRRRKQGKLVNLESDLQAHPLSGTIGIAHTRWASHGKPSEVNAHPHATSRVAVVHNGIIENYMDLKRELEAAGHVFSTETDTEVTAHLVTDLLDKGMSPLAAIQHAVKRFEGAYALVFLLADQPHTLYGARKGSPLVVGYGKQAMYFGSDALALAPFTQTISYLEEGDVAEITTNGVSVYDDQDNHAVRAITESFITDSGLDKGHYAHFMLKEIEQQPEVVGQAIAHYIDKDTFKVTLPPLAFSLASIERMSLVACGTSYYAAMIAKYWFESIAKVSVDVDIASEFRYRAPHMSKGGVALFVSQSGETADTLAALRLANQCSQHSIALVNQVESSIAREAHVVLPLLAGPEIGVASSKAFTCQLAVLASLVIAVAQAKGSISDEKASDLTRSLVRVPTLMKDVLSASAPLRDVAKTLAPVHTVLYLGRGTSFPLALEGALKLKELSYIHAEGYAAGEMKHGPIALIDEKVPVVIISPSDILFDKTHSNAEEVSARGGRLVVLSDQKGLERYAHADHKIALPETEGLMAPFVYSIPLQLMAYHTAVLKGHDVDQPRNLAKSVTIE